MVRGRPAVAIGNRTMASAWPAQSRPAAPGCGYGNGAGTRYGLGYLGAGRPPVRGYRNQS